MDYLKDLLSNIGRVVRRMSPSQVMMLFGVVAGTIVGVIFLAGWIGEVTYSRLYSNLDEAEAGEVVQYLDENKIPYQLKENGRTIEVPSNDVYQVRISLASEGLPRGGNMGYSIFDKNNLGMTDFLQNLNFRRALEGELTRTIMQLNEVQAARVHIVMPKERLFKQDKRDATASVVLKLSGKGLAQQQVAGISHLVASSVEGLEPANITILDYNGNMLSSGQETDPIAGLTATQLDINQRIETYLESKAQTMLDGVLGTGNSLVRVTADLNFQQMEKTSDLYDGNSPAVRSEERTKTTSQASDKPDESAESTQDDDSETTITNYELNHTVERIIGAVGGIERLSVAVLVDGSYNEITNSAGDAERVYQPRSQEELDRLSAIVRNAVGFDQQRSDQLEMVNIPFDRQNMDMDREALDSLYQREFYMEVAKKVGWVLLFAFLFLYFRKKSKRLFAALGRILPRAVPAVAPVAAPVEPMRAAAATEEESVEEPAPEVELEKRQERLIDKMQVAAKDQPEEIAKAIKTIMVD